MSPFVIVKMDASPVQSGSKCSSDFSIERILSDRRDSREESVEGPEWLCCTRYRPPRLPRSAAGRSRRAGRHARVPFTGAQAQALEAAYARAPYLAPPALRALAAALQLRDDRIKIWFQNRRARERREKSISIAPPQGVTLPPTTASFASSAWIPHSTFSISHNAQLFYKSQNDPETSEASYGRIPGRTSPYKNKLLSLIDRSSFSIDSVETPKKTNEDRPDTPLDIETVD